MTLPRSPIPRRTPPVKLTAKQAAKRREAGERWISSTIRPSSKTRIKKKARPANETRRIYGGEYLAYIKGLPCIGCGYAGQPSEFAHSASGGMGRKADASTGVPLCGPHFTTGEDGVRRLVEGCHRFAHRVGHRKLEKVYRVDLKARAAELWAAYAGERE